MLSVILAIPFLIIAFNPHSGSPDTGGGIPVPWEWAAACLWVLAVAGESLADAQLKAFKSDPANIGKICRKGLWSFSRHPNYFSSGSRGAPTP